MPLMPQSRFRVLVCDNVDASGLELLRSIAKVDVITKQTEEQLCQLVPNYDAIMVRSATKITEKVILAAGARLQIIGRAGVGVDNVAVQTATQKGVFVVNSPQGNTTAAAEHTVALMLALARKIPAADKSVRASLWEREKFMGSQMQHKVLGIIGLGQVGSQVAKICSAGMGMKVVSFDPYVNAARAKSLDCEMMSLDDLYAAADVITCHVPLVPDTKNLINAAALAKMKRNVLIINCSRGGVVDEAALCTALGKGDIGGAALDVYEVEKAMPADSPILSAPNLVLTPHLGASTAEAQVNVAVDVAQQIKNTLLGGVPVAAVNIPGIRSSDLAELRPLLACAEVMGRTGLQLLNGPLESVTVGLDGEYASITPSEPILLAVAAGALSVHSPARVNFVNVRRVAEEQKLQLATEQRPHIPLSSLKVVLKSADDSVELKGGVAPDDVGGVLLRSIQGTPIYMLLTSPGGTASQSPGSPTTAPAPAEQDQQQHFVYSLHRDQPSVLAKVCAVLAGFGANIGNCHVGRRTLADGTALGIAIFQIDCAATPEIKQKVVQDVSEVIECKIFAI